MTLWFALVLVLLVAIVACLVIGFNALADIFGAMMDACDE